MATHHSQTCKTCVSSLGRSSRPFTSPTPFHDLFTISCIHVLNPLPSDQIQTNCSMCVRPPLFVLPFFVLVDHVLTMCLLCRLILYGLRAHALRLSGCWVSVRRSMSSSYFDRVAILTDILFIITNVGQCLVCFHLFTYSLCSQ